MINSGEQAICKRRGHGLTPDEIYSSSGRPEPQAADAAELAMCRTRNHKLDRATYADELWRRCVWCRSWVRQVKTSEYRADEPPEDEMDMVAKTARRAARL